MNAGKLFIGTMVGVASGAILGVLYAPRKGSKTRKKLSKKGDDYTDALKDKFEEFSDSISDKFEKLSKEVSMLAKQMKEQKESF